MKPWLSVGLLALGACSPGFRSANVPITASRATIPLSFSSWLVDQDGFVDPSRLEVVGEFKYVGADCAKSVDISDEVNRQVAAAKGDAIVRLVFAGKVEDLCVKTTASGEIVRVRAAGGPK